MNVKLRGAQPEFVRDDFDIGNRYETARSAWLGHGTPTKACKNRQLISPAPMQMRYHLEAGMERALARTCMISTLECPSICHLWTVHEFIPPVGGSGKNTQQRQKPEE
jgi:hypothetical protein